MTGAQKLTLSSAAEENQAYNLLLPAVSLGEIYIVVIRCQLYWCQLCVVG